jgi:hypothetical protein
MEEKDLSIYIVRSTLPKEVLMGGTEVVEVM